MRQFWFNPALNQSLRLTLALMAALGLAYPLGLLAPVALSMLALPAVLVSALDQPTPGWWSRIGAGITGFVLTSGLTATLTHHMPTLLPVWFALLGLVLGGLAAWGELAGRLGMGMLVMAVAGLATAPQGPPWLLALSFGACVLWLMVFSALWYRLWRHYPLRQSLAATYRTLAQILLDRPGQLRAQGLPVEFDAALGEQIGLCRQQLLAFGRQGDIAPLRNAFIAAVDLQERLQATPHPEQAKALFTRPDIYPLYRDWTRAVSVRLRRLARDLSQHRPLTSDDRHQAFAEPLIAALQPLAEAGGPRGMVAYYMIGNVRRISRLAERVAPLYQRDFLPLAAPDWRARLRSVCRWSSPVARGAVRLAVLLAAGSAISQHIGLNNSYWILTTIVMVTQSSYVATRHRVGQRAAGTFAGLVIGALLVWLGFRAEAALVLALLLVPVTLALRPIHHGWTITSATTLLVLMFEYFGVGGDTILLPRMLDTLIGCVLVFVAFRWLWPQWQGGRQNALRKQALAHLHRYLQRVLMAFEGKEVEPVLLARSRRLAYEQGISLTASFQQMKQEPGYRDEATSLALLTQYKGAMSQINAVVPFARRGVVLEPEVAERLRRSFDEAYKVLAATLEGQSYHWPPQLDEASSWLSELLMQQQPNRAGFVLYQMALLLERYQRLSSVLAGQSGSSPDSPPEDDSPAQMPSHSGGTDRSQ
ncbi:FUSC family membrane protein [Ferrimonas balearica]|uniref:FUSC family membrane protein n=1 Tax=Ferrimonas balearica TaxID=44012 RepID=UPI002D80B5B5|nr:FUSC family membrane protein [Ferrimonas balearica]MBY6093875.1 FUSC family protein [Ferrimonas balearica]